jgi:gamma-glutamylcyclotransferase (GGCT)/AIG2-like uncharacterized protein YtfP
VLFFNRYEIKESPMAINIDRSRTMATQNAAPNANMNANARRRIRVFTYGTLMQGQGNHDVIRDGRLQGTDSVKGFDLFDLGPYPAVKESSRACAEVHGEVYLVNARTLAMLDRLEGCPRLYTRERITLTSGETAWMYVYAQDPTLWGHELPTGRWTTHGIQLSK